MSIVIARVLREPAALLGVVTATLGLLTLLEVFNPEVAGSTGVLLGALIALGRFIVTPTAEVVVQQTPSGDFVAGRASDIVTGTVVDADVQPTAAPLAVRADIRRRRTNRGATTMQQSIAVLLILTLCAAFLVLLA